ncbi:MAG TPA: DUF4331 family protein [Planctomycetota bacterium]|nr:DUF4331 family protein [Planctomycetota bacterium]
MNDFPIRLLALAGIAGALALSVGCGHDDDDDDDAPVADAFVFEELRGEVNSQEDMMGMPAINTALVGTSRKESYNKTNLAAQTAGLWVPEFTTRLNALHAALDDDLTGLGLTPCSTNEALEQGGPLVIPDTVKIDTTTAAGFPNGRRLQDQAIDLTLAVVLLDLDVHPVTTFAGLPLNPAANDKPFLTEFPYLAAPF